MVSYLINSFSNIAVMYADTNNYYGGGYYGGGYYYGFDPSYILVVIGMILCAIASMGVKSTFNKYEKVRSASGMTGAQAAQKILTIAGITDVRIERVHGELTDHYDPRNKVLRLSDSTYSSASVAAIGVAAHECGHAVQHNVSYGPLVLRSTIVPIANVSSKLAMPVILLGLILGLSKILIPLGIVLFSVGVFFQIITLPVEFNASKRAVAILRDNYILSDNELVGTKKVLTAAAMTYLASAFAIVLQLIRLILLSRRNDD